MVTSFELVHTSRKGQEVLSRSPRRGGERGREEVVGEVKRVKTALDGRFLGLGREGGVASEQRDHCSCRNVLLGDPSLCGSGVE